MLQLLLFVTVYPEKGKDSLSWKHLTCDGLAKESGKFQGSKLIRAFVYVIPPEGTYLPDGRNAETFAPHRSCCTETCLDSRRKLGNSPPVGPANWSGCPLCSSSSPGTEECNRIPVYRRTWFEWRCNEKWYSHFIGLHLNRTFLRSTLASPATRTFVYDIRSWI